MNEPPELPSESNQDESNISSKKVNYNLLSDNKMRVQAVIIVFSIFIVVSLFSLYSGYLEIQLISGVSDGVQITDDMADENDTRQAGVQILLNIIRLLTIPLFLMWFYNTYGNLHVLGRTKMKFSHSASLYNWFIPFINWVQPYFMMRELWNNIQEEIKIDDPTYVIEKSDPKIGLWWFLFLCTNLLGQIVLLILDDSDTLDTILLTSKAIFFINAFKLLEAVFVINIVFKISQKENMIIGRKA